MFVWGHSWELDKNETGNSWEHIENFCKMIGNRDDIWYATAIEVVDYLNAIQSLQFHNDNTALYVANPSGVSVWMKTGKGLVEIKPGEKLKLDRETK